MGPTSKRFDANLTDTHQPEGQQKKRVTHIVTIVMKRRQHELTQFAKTKTLAVAVQSEILDARSSTALVQEARAHSSLQLHMILNQVSLRMLEHVV